MKKRTRKIVGLVLILLFPSLFYVILSTGSHEFITTPYYGANGLDAEGDTVYQKYDRPELWLKDSFNVVSFLNPTDSLLSYRLVFQMKELEADLERVPDLAFSFMVDNNVEGELTQTLKSEVYAIPGAKWVSTSKKKQSDILESLQSKVPYSDSVRTFYEWVLLFDKEGYVRGTYDGKQYVDIKRLKDDLKVLKAGEFVPKKNSDE